MDVNRQVYEAIPTELDADLADVISAMQRGEMTADEALEELVARRSSGRGPAAVAAKVADILDERRGRAPALPPAEGESTEPTVEATPAASPAPQTERPITAAEGLRMLEELRASRKPSPEELASQVADILERRRQYR